MKVVLFGATGMVGQGALQACLEDPNVTRVLAVGRTPSGVKNSKVKDLIHKDFLNFAPLKGSLTGYDACFYCLGVTSNGMTEADYKRITHDFTLAAAKVLAQANPTMTFVFVSGSGADSTGKSPFMWARVKGLTENDLMKMQFKATYIIRPSFIQPLDGIQSRTKLYNVLYRISTPIYPLLKTLFPSIMTTTRQIGQAMIKLAREGGPKKLLVSTDINALSSE